MIPFEMAEPASLEEAVAMLDPQEPTIRPVAGGTALMLMMKAGVFRPTRLVSLHRVEPEHARITVNGSGELRIGALAHGDPHMDLPPVLAALAALVSVTGPDGTRDLPLAELYTGYYETVLAR